MKIIKRFFSALSIGSVFCFDGYPEAYFKKTGDFTYAPVDADPAISNELLRHDYVCCMMAMEE